jgi:hypothetical protein
MHYYPFYSTLDPTVVVNPLVVLCLVDRTPVEVRWHVPLARFRAFYTLVNEWNVKKLNS